MKILKTLIVFLIVPLAFITLKCNSNIENNSSTNIHHSAFFKLKDSLSNTGKEIFFTEINKLATIEGVIDFKVVNETSPKNHFTNGVTMEFVDQKAYDSYNTNPQHQKFVKEIWLKMVEDFMEIDYVQENKN